MSEFEKQLQRQPLREIPAAWRETILEAAAQAQPAPRSNWLSVLKSRLASLLWPYPKAWGALAGVWILVFALNFDSRDTSHPVFARVPPPTPAVELALKQQRILLAELIGTREAPVAESTKHKPQPRTERKVEQVIV